jgi:aminoglycoside phosphotransferase
MSETMTAHRTLADLIDEVDGRIACLAMSKDPDAKVTVMFFPPGQKLPGYVAKVPTTDVASRSVEREAGVLAEIARADLGPLRPTVPQIVMTAVHTGWPVLVTSALPGQAMLARYHRWRHTARPAAVTADFSAAASWLSDLQHRTASGRVGLESMLEGVAAAIMTRFGDLPDVASDLANVAELERRLAQHRIPATVVHGDYWPGNLLVEGRTVAGVIDWEFGRLAGPPTRDLARFVIGYSLYLDRHTSAGRKVAGHPGLQAGQWGAGLEYAADGRGWYPDVARGHIQQGLTRLGIPPSCWRDVLLAELAATTAEADHPGFAEESLLLFRRMCRRGPQ